MSEIGFGEIAVILVVALLVFGPDRLPTMVKQAASFIRDLRTMVTNARRDLSESVGDLGIDEEDLRTLRNLRNPKSFVRQKVLDGVDMSTFGFDEFEEAADELDVTGKRKQRRNGTGASAGNRASDRAGTSRGTTGAKPRATAAKSTSRAAGTASANVESTRKAAATGSAGGTGGTGSASAGSTSPSAGAPSAAPGSSSPSPGTTIAGMKFDPDAT